ncbi:adenosine 3'-phospho 5'-phosphosulfate transporter 2-like isoform X1 [Watersipora subatra]|uniref:adenosine 3'-phospho 5'-phosphosulfate transporter 2-like isoform X1 n=1 Tax=Watersipora subatra TaxID=2589382 RepID=UPI00355BE601
MLESGTQDSRILLCLDISRLNRVSQFLLSTALVLASFLIYGYILEMTFHLEGMKEYSWYFTMLEFLQFSIFGLGERVVSHRCGLLKHKAPMSIYMLLAALTVATIGLSNMSVGYLNYPTQVIFKCCKLIPVLIGGIVIQGKKYGIIDFLARFTMSVSLILFTLTDSEIQPNFNIYGVVIISGALCADAAVGNVTEKTLNDHKATNSELILFSYSIGFVYIMFGLLLSAQLAPGFMFFQQHPLETYGYGAVFAITGYVGLNAILFQIKHFGVLAAVTVTTFRKMLTIILSFILFSKPFTFRYIWSGLIVLGGMLLNFYSKKKDIINNKFSALYKQMCQKKEAALLDQQNDSIDHI